MKQNWICQLSSRVQPAKTVHGQESYQSYKKRETCFRSTSRINNQFHMASKEGSLDQSPGSRNYFYLCYFYMCFQTVHSWLCCQYMSMHVEREPYSKTLWKLSYHKSIVLVARSCVQRKDLILLITCKCAPKLEPCISLICLEHMIWLLWLNMSHKHLKISI